MCILLVVYGHVVGGLVPAGVVTGSSIFDVLRDWVYLFHIPAFFFLSGLFAQRATRPPFVQFLQGRVRVLLYPYFVWTAIFLLAQFAMGSFVNTPPSVSRALRCLWEPYGVGLWFLYSLFLVSLFFDGLMRLRVPAIPGVLIGVVLYLLWHRNVFGFWYILNESMGFALFFTIGGYWPGLATTHLANARWGRLLASAVGLLALMTLLQLVRFDLAGVPKLTRALLGVCGVVCLAMVLARTAMKGLLSVLGVYSLEIYLAHPLWATASRGLLMRCRVHAPVVFVVSGVVLGVGASLAMGMACKRMGFPYLFRWPTKRPRPSTAPDALGAQMP